MPPNGKPELRGCGKQRNMVCATPIAGMGFVDPLGLGHISKCKV